MVLRGVKWNTGLAGRNMSQVSLPDFGFAPDELQKTVLESTASRGILNCTRQWGKSTVCAIKAIHRAYT